MKIKSPTTLNIYGPNLPKHIDWESAEKIRIHIGKHQDFPQMKDDVDLNLWEINRPHTETIQKFTIIKSDKSQHRISFIDEYIGKRVLKKKHEFMTMEWRNGHLYRVKG